MPRSRARSVAIEVPAPSYHSHVTKLTQRQRTAIADAIDAELSPEAFQMIVDAIEVMLAGYWYCQQCVRYAQVCSHVAPARQRRAVQTMQWLRTTTLGLSPQENAIMRALETRLLELIALPRPKWPKRRMTDQLAWYATGIVHALETAQVPLTIGRKTPLVEVLAQVRRFAKRHPPLPGDWHSKTADYDFARRALAGYVDRNHDSEKSL
jgi:hypothetical protein